MTKLSTFSLSRRSTSLLRKRKSAEYLLKFSQIPRLKEVLINTGNKILVEASPFDKIWGIGMRESDKDAPYPERWRGFNNLGNILMEVRNELLTTNTEDKELSFNAHKKEFNSLAHAAYFQYSGKRDNFHFFYSHTNPLSQHFLSDFEIDDKKFNCCEQYMMYQKAVTFNDEEAKRLIMDTDDPNLQKKYGRMVKNFNRDIWANISLDIVKKANLAKFSQIPRLKEVLINTGNKILVEASPFDKIWGIGMRESDKDAPYPERWRGFNNLGNILMEVRNELLTTNTEDKELSFNAHKKEFNSLAHAAYFQYSGKRDNFHFFYSHTNTLSQHFLSDFEIDDKKFNCCEQYMMYQKAVTFNDEEAKRLIMDTDDPNLHKKYGRMVKNFNRDIWTNISLDIVKKANLAKFSQIPRLKEVLINTGNKILVEASPFDKIWGIGMRESDKDAPYPERWRGFNNLGNILMEVRNELLEHSHDDTS